ncbi:MAG: SDR family oxidoreductase [Bacteroidota bacterium]
MENFKDKIVVITGAGSGIGRALAMAFAKLGARLALNDFQQEGLDETLTLLEEQSSPDILTSIFDVADRASMEAFAEKVKSEWGNAHIIINNAGMPGGNYPAYLTPEDMYRRVMEVNFFGVLNGCQIFLPQIVENQEGAVVNISSIFGLMGTANNSAYCASKFAVRGYTETLVAEFQKSPISIHCVHPGGIKTNIASSVDDAEKFDGKFLTTPPEDLAQAIIKGIINDQPRIIYGNYAGKTWFGARFIPQKILNAIMWKRLGETVNLEDYRSFIKDL